MFPGDQGQAYKEWISGIFGRSSAAYGLVGPNFFTYFGTKLVEYAGLYPGAKVLDVACGRGACLFPAAEKVSPSRSVIGIESHARNGSRDRAGTPSTAHLRRPGY